MKYKLPKDFGTRLAHESVCDKGMYVLGAPRGPGRKPRKVYVLYADLHRALNKQFNNFDKLPISVRNSINYSN